MKVYLVILHDLDRGIEKIFLTKDKAEKYAKKLNREHNCNSFWNWYVDEVEVEE